MSRSTILVDAKSLVDVVGLVSRFVSIVGSEHAEDGNVSLAIEGRLVPPYCDRVEAIIHTAVEGTLRIEFRKAS